MPHLLVKNCGKTVEAGFRKIENTNWLIFSEPPDSIKAEKNTPNYK
jgi:hypothetical protein